MMTLHAGIIGYPVGHSLSPLLHQFWLDQYGIEGHYARFELTEDNVKNSVTGLAEQCMVGVNVTVPYKQTVMPYMDELSPEAQAIGAVNIIVVHRSGRLEGRNSDAYGFMAHLAENYPHLSLKGKKVVVLGAGGAARAIVYGLCQQQAQVVICNRSLDKAQLLSDDMGALAIDWAQRDAVLDDAALVVNTTLLGMAGQAELGLSLEYLPKQAIVADIVYKPLYTSLLHRAMERGNPILDGLGMLLHQAVPAFEAWFGVRPQVTPALRQHIEEALG